MNISYDDSVIVIGDDRIRYRDELESTSPKRYDQIGILLHAWGQVLSTLQDGGTRFLPIRIVNPDYNSDILACFRVVRRGDNVTFQCVDVTCPSQSVPTEIAAFASVEQLLVREYPEVFATHLLSEIVQALRDTK